jgi:hypothetical protein
MAQQNQLSTSWWGQFELADRHTIEWTIASLKFAIQSLPNEWQLGYEWDDSIDPETTDWSCAEIESDLTDLAYSKVERFVMGQWNETLWLKPGLADRSVIVRPLTPLYLPAGETTTIFVSTPLWVRVEAGRPLRHLQEIPIRRLSDTWFGPTTMEGELGYAGRTFARLNLENVPIRAHRAVTRVTIQNNAATELLIERLSLPVPYLSMFETADGLLWTEAVTLVRTRDTDMVNLQIEADLPQEVKGAKLIGEPRLRPEQNMVIRAFGALFG